MSGKRGLEEGVGKGGLEKGGKRTGWGTRNGSVSKKGLLTVQDVCEVLRDVGLASLDQLRHYICVQCADVDARRFRHCIEVGKVQRLCAAWIGPCGKHAVAGCCFLLLKFKDLDLI